MGDRSMMALLVPLVLTGCVSMHTFEDERHRREAAEADLARQVEFTAGAHADSAMLQRSLIEHELLVRALEGGMAVQAEMTAEAREACDL